MSLCHRLWALQWERDTRQTLHFMGVHLHGLEVADGFFVAMDGGARSPTHGFLAVDCRAPSVMQATEERPLCFRQALLCCESIVLRGFQTQRISGTFGFFVGSGFVVKIGAEI